MSRQVSVARPTSVDDCSALRNGWYSPTSRVPTAGCGIPRTAKARGVSGRVYARGGPRRRTREVEPQAVADDKLAADEVRHLALHVGEPAGICVLSGTISAGGVTDLRGERR